MREGNNGGVNAVELPHPHTARAASALQGRNPSHMRVPVSGAPWFLLACSPLRHAPIALKGPPPIKSAIFVPLGSPQNYTELLENAEDNSVSVIKFQAPYCRTCRATSPLLDRVCKQHPEARFYSMDLARDGKAAGERMNKFFKERQIKQMPYIEVFYGKELVDTEVVPPSAIDTFSNVLDEIMERWRLATSSSRGASRQLVLFRQFLREQRLGGKKAGSESQAQFAESASTAASLPPAAKANAGFRKFLANPPWQPAAFNQAQQSRAPRRGAPQRGATGGRRKGMR